MAVKQRVGLIALERVRVAGFSFVQISEKRRKEPLVKFRELFIRKHYACIKMQTNAFKCRLIIEQII
jgi:hypothetical protein